MKVLLSAGTSPAPTSPALPASLARPVGIRLAVGPLDRIDGRAGQIKHLSLWQVLPRQSDSR